jgi:hypothetical protein
MGPEVESGEGAAKELLSIHRVVAGVNVPDFIVGRFWVTTEEIYVDGF